MARDQWMSGAETAEYLGLTMRTLYRLAYADEVRAYKRGRALRFRRRDVDAFVESRRIKPGDLSHLYPSLIGQDQIEAD